MSDDEYDYDLSRSNSNDDLLKQFILSQSINLTEQNIVVLNNKIFNHNLIKLDEVAIQNIQFSQYESIYSDFLSIQIFEQHYNLTYYFNDIDNTPYIQQYFKLEGFTTKLIPIEQFFQIDNICYIYQTGIVIKIEDQFSFYNFDQLNHVKHSHQYEILEMVDKFQEQFSQISEQNAYIIFENGDQNNFYKKHIKPTTHWLKNQKYLIQDGVIFENKLCFNKQIPRTNQIEINEAMFLTYIDNYYYFYSSNVCYKTNASFEIIEKREIDFPYSLYKAYGEFRTFSNDYIIWFETAECNGKHYSNVYDMIYEFGVFTVKKLANIPDYPTGEKNNHKLVSVNGQVFVTNGTNIFIFNPVNFSYIKINSFESAYQQLRIHNLNEQLMCRSNRDNQIFVLDLEYQKGSVTDFNTRDLILANKKYFINYYEQFQISYIYDGEIKLEERSIKPINDDVLLANYILLDGQWDLTDASFKKFLGATKQELSDKCSQSNDNILKDNVLNIFKDYLQQDTCNSQLAMYILNKVQTNGIASLTKRQKSSYFQLLVETNQYQAALKLTDQFPIKMSFNAIFQIIKEIQDPVKLMSIMKTLNENELEDMFEFSESQMEQDALIQLLVKCNIISKYIFYKVKKNETVSQTLAQIIMQMAQKDKQEIFELAIEQNNIFCVRLLMNEKLEIVSDNIIINNISPEIARLLFSVNPKKYSELQEHLIQNRDEIDIALLNFKPKDEVSAADYLYLQKKNIDAKCFEESFAVYQQMIKNNQIPPEQLPAHLKKHKFNKNLTNQFGVNFERDVQFTDVFNRTNKDFKTLNEQIMIQFEGSVQSDSNSYTEETENEEENGEEDFENFDDEEEFGLFDEDEDSDF
ncbi:Conserved_hypothetical protein [Hexamita inflata]|uniref:Uncharacterized protein n=1 Tax=Hexamita inflata TaxID=28002 RepID=A0AA86PVB3_9EUKA|nr:Conserved hypothetical protein [Hexamita inflata]